MTGNNNQSMSGGGNAFDLLTGLSKNIRVAQKLTEAGLDATVVLHLQSQKLMDERLLIEITFEQLIATGLLAGDALEVKRAYPLPAK